MAGVVICQSKGPGRRAPSKTQARQKEEGSEPETHVAEGRSPEALSSRRLRRQTAEARSAEHEPVGREGEA